MARLADYASFSAGRELALNLRPTEELAEAERRQQETSEARGLLKLKSDLSLGGVRDVRLLLKRALIGASITPTEFLEIRDTLLGAKALRRTLSGMGSQFPLLAAKAWRIEECPHVVGEISRCINDRAEVVDSASENLARIRRELREAHDRLMKKLNEIIASPASLAFLQEPIITQRGGRYVIPLKSECKGRIPGLVHDESSSGATLFIEPLATVELNNRWREAQLEEEREIRRILAGLADLVAEEADFISRTVEVLAELDLAFAKARYAEEIKGSAPRLVPFREYPASPHPGSRLRLQKARHPLLDPARAVPIDVYLDKDYFILVITGPNTGGKTVCLKTVGLLALMAQAGLQIPAEEGSTLSVFNGIYADIGDEQSIEQSLSTFSSHMTNIVHILEGADSHSLVLLDELGAGTDPAEGSALARALLLTLLHRRVTTLATTHSSDLKVFAHATPGVENASVEFDPETLAPTFELSIGLPGRSNAFAIASRLGLPGEIINEARNMLSPQSLEAEELLAEIKRAQKETLNSREIARAARQEAESLRQELQERLRDIEEARREVLNAARDQARSELEMVSEELRRLRATLEMRNLSRQWLAEAEEKLAHLEQEAAPVARFARAEPSDGPLAQGDIVWVKSLRSSGEIIALAGDEAEVQVGHFRVRVDRADLELRQRKPRPTPAPERPTSTMVAFHAPARELDMRGRRVEEIPPLLERYLDEAYLAGLGQVRIIHGKGTGALRRAVRKLLHEHPLVASQRPGDRYEGGDGVTIAELMQP